MWLRKEGGPRTVSKGTVVFRSQGGRGQSSPRGWRSIRQGGRRHPQKGNALEAGLRKYLKEEKGD